MTRFFVRIATATLILMLPTAASAHTGAGHAAGFVHGFAHPVGGLDHVLAMVLVGILAWQLGGRALFAVPASFVLLMAVGGALGVAGIKVPFVETGIALSITVFGAAVAFGVRAPVAAMAAFVGLFAVFHGHAHGAEMPADAQGIGYAAGFMLATALLHAAGVGLGFVLGRISAGGQGIAVRAAGGAAALTGLAILSGAI